MTGINIAFGLGSGLFLLRSVLEDIASKNAYKKKRPTINCQPLYQMIISITFL